METVYDQQPRPERMDPVPAPAPEQNRQRLDYDENANVQSLHSAIARKPGDISLTIRPFPLWVLAVCGLAIFFTGFFWSRSAGNAASAGFNAGNNPPPAESNQQTVSATANQTTTVTGQGAEPAPAGIVHVVIKNMKFDPASVEVKSGDTVEWKNQDITPHTATSATFDSGSIDSEKSWKHTFTAAGDFPYACTFHPEMKAVVIVK